MPLGQIFSSSLEQRILESINTVRYSFGFLSLRFLPQSKDAEPLSISPKPSHSEKNE